MNFIDVPWRTCDNSWNTRLCISAADQLNKLCWKDESNDTICPTPFGNFSHSIMKDPVKEFWEYVHLYLFICDMVYEIMGDLKCQKKSFFTSVSI